MLDVENILENLVKCNTIKDKENKKILDYIENTLGSLGFRTEKRGKYLIMYNKENISIGFLGHTDTVEFSDNWNFDKFSLTKFENKLFGLGVCDMKSGIAAIISAISQIDFSKYNTGIKLYFTYDEEIGFSGINDVIEYENNFPKMMLIGEPTNNEIIVGSKGLMEYRILFKGVKAHSSTPDKGKSAIMSAVSFINELNEFYVKEIKNVINENFEIPYTTMNIGTINGGSAINSVPDSCELLIDFRTTDNVCEDKVVKRLSNLEKKYQAKIQELNRLPSFLNKTDMSDKTCNFITEASFLEGDKIILGAGPVTAHEVNEYVSIDSLYKLVKQYKVLIEKYCSKK